MSVFVGLGHLHSFLPLSQMLVSSSATSAPEYLLPAHPALHWLLTVLSEEPGLLTPCGALGTLLSFLCSLAPDAGTAMAALCGTFPGHKYGSHSTVESS